MEIRITEAEQNLVLDLYDVISELEEANNLLFDFYETINELYTGESTSQITEYVLYMRNHISQLSKFYLIGASYILKTWEKFSEADRNTAMSYVLTELFPSYMPIQKESADYEQ